jgi:hypothetical protein
MHDDGIRKHIEAAANRPPGDTRRLTDGIVGGCWPGGGADRTEPAARRWLRRWRPETAVARLPVCSCTSGHCLVCN